MMYLLFHKTPNTFSLLSTFLILAYPPKYFHNFHDFDKIWTGSNFLVFFSVIFVFSPSSTYTILQYPGQVARLPVHQAVQQVMFTQAKLWLGWV